MNTLLAGTVALGLILCAGTSWACSCLKEEFFLRKDDWAVEALAARTDIVHARVVEVLPGRSARIEAVNVLKGAVRYLSCFEGQPTQHAGSVSNEGKNSFTC